jgi:hypothetical protein
MADPAPRGQSDQAGCGQEKLEKQKSPCRIVFISRELFEKSPLAQKNAVSPGEGSLEKLPGEKATQDGERQSRCLQAENARENEKNRERKRKRIDEGPEESKRGSREMEAIISGEEWIKSFNAIGRKHLRVGIPFCRADSDGYTDHSAGEAAVPMRKKTTSFFTYFRGIFHDLVVFSRESSADFRKTI